MTANGSGPASGATEDEARGFDQLASEITSEHCVTPIPPQAALISAIKEDLAQGEKAERKADKHFRSAGRRLKELKASTASWAEWEALLKTKIGISTGRASELMQIGEGRKTVGELRASNAEANKRLRDRRSSSRDEENGGDPEASAEAGAPESHITADGKARKQPSKPAQRELEAAQAHIVELEAALEHDRDLAEKLREAEIRMAGMASEIEELKTAADAGAGLSDPALKLASLMSDAERAQFLVKVKQAYPPRRGRPRKRPQAEAEGSIMTAALDIPATLAPAHDSGDGLDIPECLKRVAP